MDLNQKNNSLDVLRKLGGWETGTGFAVHLRPSRKNNWQALLFNLLALIPHLTQPNSFPPPALTPCLQEEQRHVQFGYFWLGRDTIANHCVDNVFSPCLKQVDPMVLVHRCLWYSHWFGISGTCSGLLPNYSVHGPLRSTQHSPQVGKEKSPTGSVSFSLRTAYNPPGIGDTLISPQHLKEAADTAGNGTHHNRNTGTWCSTQGRSKPCNCAAACAEHQRSSSLRHPLEWSRRRAERDCFVEFL